MHTPAVEKLTGGVWSLPIPIPDNPLGFTYVYLVEGSEGPLLIDTGWNHDQSWQALLRAVERTGHTIEEIRGAVLTHFHPDHAGLAGRLRKTTGAWIAMHPADIAVLQHLGHRSMEERRAIMATQLRRAGFPEEDVEALLLVDPLPASAIPDRELQDGTVIDLPGRDLRAVWTPGHSPGHLCLHLADGDVLFTGDHVLPRITPHVGQFPLTADDGNPLGDFLTSQGSIGRTADADRLVCLPSHERRFTNLTRRTKEITAHHEERLDETTALLTEGPATLWEITSGMSWRRPWNDMRVHARHMAAAETAAHLRLLEERGRIHRTGSDTLPRWALVGDSPHRT